MGRLGASGDTEGVLVVVVVASLFPFCGFELQLIATKTAEK